MTQPTFQTERLNVFSMAFVASEVLDTERIVFVAYFREEDWPGQVVVATVSPANAVCGPRVDWIETTTPNRRHGYAAELWRGIEKHLGVRLVAEGASDEGTALCEKMERANEGMMQP